MFLFFRIPIEFKKVKFKLKTPNFADHQILPTASQIHFKYPEERFIPSPFLSLSPPSPPLSRPVRFLILLISKRRIHPSIHHPFQEVKLKLKTLSFANHLTASQIRFKYLAELSIPSPFLSLSPPSPLFQGLWGCLILLIFKRIIHPSKTYSRKSNLNWRLQILPTT